MLQLRLAEQLAGPLARRLQDIAVSRDRVLLRVDRAGLRLAHAATARQGFAVRRDPGGFSCRPRPDHVHQKRPGARIGPGGRRQVAVVRRVNRVHTWNERKIIERRKTRERRRETFSSGIIFFTGPFWRACARLRASSSASSTRRWPTSLCSPFATTRAASGVWCLSLSSRERTLSRRERERE